MIRYRLSCPDRHEFDAWFRSSAAYDAQSGAGQVTCPQCGSHDIEKALMAPTVKSRRADEGKSGQPKRPMASLMPPELAQMMRKIRDHVRENADYVGDKFADEARKIHYEEVEVRGIYGEATMEEAQELHEEGIPFQPLPVLPEDKN
jgi:hypothetical protein